MRRKDNNYIALTPDLITRLRAERDRTSVGPQALLKLHRDGPNGLNHRIVTHWLAGRVKTADREQVDYVLSAWSTLKTCRSVEVSSELLAELRDMQQRSGKSAEMIVKWAQDVPDGLTAAKIERCMAGQSKTMRQDYIEFMRGAWAQ